ncbi:hypothetical protein [Alkalicoccobacillus murimartini]|uniref:Uncharacterized protein n=1 Tax=Alkalicoccobacillus murimartini TaxID=171685 RepID=A0ABT9YEE6_9BACI|nr:hypothetical protein [Alkalicoccobacillus murimartini]MDQ0206228.1 hypothetical protein [Alkalicoccobacillus murimartini]
MTKEQAISLLEELRTGSRADVSVEKADFLLFREVLMDADDLKHFRGKARHHGVTIYTYEPGWSQ